MEAYWKFPGGKTAFVTGAARWVGYKIALALVDEGVNIA
jgi:NAD(P)-dependent dehydrogenase (short-subunit alcohol dehydrogenase family)